MSRRFISIEHKQTRVVMRRVKFDQKENLPNYANRFLNQNQLTGTLNERKLLFVRLLNVR